MGIEIVRHCPLPGSYISFILPCPRPESPASVTACLLRVPVPPHPHLTVPGFAFRSSRLIHVLPLAFLALRNLCRLLVALDSWAPSPRAQALTQSLEMQGQRL